MTKLTLKNLFAQNCAESEEWDVGWIEEIKIPQDRVTNKAQAEERATQFARAAEWCGEKIAILTVLVEEAKDAYKKTYAEALLWRSGDPKMTQPMKKAKADCDAAYLADKSKYNDLKGHLEWFQQRQTALMNGYYAMSNIVKNSAREYPLSGWETTDNAYKTPERPPEKKEEEEPAEDPEDFEIDNL